MNAMGDLHKAFACSVPYLRLWGTVAGGWQMARAAQIAAAKIAAGDPEADFYRAKLATAAFYASHVLSQCAWYQRQIVDGSGDVMALDETQFELDRKRRTVGVLMIPQEPRDDVRVITLDNPPVNALSFAYCAKLRAEIAAAQRRRGRRTVIVSPGPTASSAAAPTSTTSTRAAARTR